MKDFKIKSFQWLLNERKSKPCAKAKSEETKAAVAEMPKHKWLGIDELDNYKGGDTAVYIQDVNGNFWNVSDWDGSVEPNAIAMLTPEHKFRIALSYTSKKCAHAADNDKWERILMPNLDRHTAQADYNGASNTKLIVEKCQSATTYAFGWCNAYTFPDGSKGYLPALGELCLAQQNKSIVDEALAKCGGAKLPSGFHWSSTFCRANVFGRFGWGLDLDIGRFLKGFLSDTLYVRAFASLEL